MTPNTVNSFFAQPKFIVGSRALEHIPVELDGYNSCRPMVITNRLHGGRFKRNILNSLAESNVTIGAYFEDVQPYVNKTEIERLAGLYTWNECDSIIAIGGSGVLDVAKSLAVCIRNGNKFSPDFPFTSKVVLVYIATSFIDGYEVTGSINVDGKRIQSDLFYPDLVCIDNRMVITNGNQEQIIDASLLSLASCIEGVSDPKGNPFADSAAFSAIRLIVDNLPLLLKKTSNKKVLLAVINGITIAGTVRHNSKPGVVVLASQFLSKHTGYNKGALAGFLIKSLIKYKIDNALSVRDDLLLALDGMENYSKIPKDQRVVESLRILNVLVGNLSQINQFIKIQTHLIAQTAEFVEKQSGGQISSKDALSILTSAIQKS